MNGPPVVGIDFDNTIATYDQLFHRLAVERGLIDREVPPRKRQVRDAVRLRADGESQWQHLQASAYGTEMAAATMAPGVAEFLARCRDDDTPIYIVSHRTRHAAGDRSGVLLREAAVGWMRAQGLFAASLGVREDRVFFELTRAEKIARIASVACSHFIDDLEEVLNEPGFPSGVVKVLYAPDRERGRAAIDGIQTVGNWSEVYEVIVVGSDEMVVSDVCSRLLGRAVARVDRIHGGRNSQVFRIECGSGPQPDRYVAKQYFAIPEDPRDRLGTEFRALQLIRSFGIASVPAPIAMDADARCAIYEWLPGERASLRAADDEDIRQAVALLTDLQAVARRSGAADAAPASEACFSIDAIARNLSARVTRLRALSEDEPGVAGLRRFLGVRVAPFASRLDAWTIEQARIHGLHRAEVLPLDQRTLSPSDFGFHNALRDADGRLRFVDFEYFGWDDPAKTIVDFLHHPAMEMTGRQRRAFAACAVSSFADVTGLEARARIVYPWFGLKWCLIVLNEFVPADLRRRRFAGATGTNRIELLNAQLDRAGRLLDRIDAEYRHNPYFDR